MKVLDLHCRNGHVFEGWFASEEDFQSQLQRHLVRCPLCGDDQVAKQLSAPRLHLGARAEPSPLQEPPSEQAKPVALSGQQAAWLRLAREVMARTEDVGQRFAQEARRMHHGDIPERAIRGQATVQQAHELLEEGIGILALPSIVKETLQ